MCNDDKFWVSFWSIIGIVVVIISFIVADYWKDQNLKIVKLIQSGVPAVEAKCAMQDDYGKMPVCLVIAAKR